MERVGKHIPQSSEHAARAVQAGRVVVLPTDTLYGFTAALFDQTARRNILRLKGAGAKRFLYLASDVDMVERHIASWGCISKAEMRTHWPAPVTCVFTSDRCPSWIGDTVALRVPDDEWLRRVIARVGEPLLSTSVNLAGGSPLASADDIERHFGDDVQLMVVDDEGTSGESSTLVDMTTPAPRVIRLGAYAWPTGEKPSK